MDGIPSSQWRMLAQPQTFVKPPAGLDGLWVNALGRVGQLWRRSETVLKRAERIMAQEKTYAKLTNARLLDQVGRLKERFLLGRDTGREHRQGMAIIAEVAARTVGLRPYREQLAGALALHTGCIAEMATGEGKTLVATMAAVFAGWRGHGCHVITANDYLARRDARLMKALYRFCDLTVDCIETDMPPAARKKAYDAQITYVTNKEAAADFLRDRLLSASSRGVATRLLARMSDGQAGRAGQLVQRGLVCAIVDEADSVFIDDASTPMLISGDAPNQTHSQAYEQAAELSGELAASLDYMVSKNEACVYLTRSGKKRLADLARNLPGLWSVPRRREELVLQALTAKSIFVRDKQYVVKAGKVIIIDETTGRLMPDRTWRLGLQQAIEAKEGLTVNLPKETYARISFQRFFRLYRKLAGMSGTATESKSELWNVYGLPVIPIPTHRSCQRKVMPDRLYRTEIEKWDAVVTEICSIHHSGRPILIGTGSVGDSKLLSNRLSSLGIEHQLLNAVHHASEAEIIAGAGQAGCITVSTNMAGRGTDIQLGEDVAKRGGLHVIATERFSSQRIDRQLAGRCARQGDPGSCQVFLSLEDELVRKFGGGLEAPVGYLGHRNGEIPSALGRGFISVLQRRAAKFSSRLRKDVLDADSRLEQQLGFAARDI